MLHRYKVFNYLQFLSSFSISVVFCCKCTARKRKKPFYVFYVFISVLIIVIISGWIGA